MSLIQEIEEKTKEFHGNTDESAYDVLLIPAKHIGEIWKHVVPMLLYGLHANPKMGIREVADGLVDQSIQLWVIVPKDEDDAIYGCFLTSVERDRGEWVVSLFGLGGRHPKRWVAECHATMHRFARREGAARVRLCGRRAWSRILPDYRAVGEAENGHLIYERAVE
jgi:hypothetical protein